MTLLARGGGEEGNERITSVGLKLKCLVQKANDSAKSVTHMPKWPILWTSAGPVSCQLSLPNHGATLRY